MQDTDNDLLIHRNFRKENCINILPYAVYFIYHILLIGLVSVNTFYTINLASNIKDDTDQISDELHSILDIIHKYINSTFN